MQENALEAEIERGVVGGGRLWRGWAVEGWAMKGEGCGESGLRRDWPMERV